MKIPRIIWVGVTALVTLLGYLFGTFIESRIDLLLFMTCFIGFGYGCINSCLPVTVTEIFGVDGYALL